MRIGSIYEMQNMLQTQNKISAVNNRNIDDKKELTVEAGATYQKIADKVNTDFGGYTNKGVKVNKAADTQVRVDNEDGRVRVSNNSKSVMEGVSKILKADSRAVMDKLQANGLDREDLVNPDKVKMLSNDAVSKDKLAKYAASSRASLLNETGMNNKQLDDFVNSAKEKFNSEYAGIVSAYL